ncbi:MAG: PAS domain S-box protein [Verrucomicrobiae bacterium]|nr:PAS domain S-box protein [Verrucomicrobiae bacterium]
MTLAIRNLSIKRKQMLIIMLTSSIALLLACAAFVAYDAFTFPHLLIKKESGVADLIGKTVTAAIDFNDSKTAGESLAALRAEPNIVSACIYDSNGSLFATYQRDGGTKAVDFPAVHLPGYEFAGSQLHIFQDIKQGDARVGVIFISSDLDELSQRLGNYAGIVGLVFGVSLLIALWLSSRLQRVISNPVLHLAQLARTVALEKNYSLRAEKQGHDELGQLVEWFNEMLAQIQQRDSALQTARDHLEQRVKERTTKLAESLSVLNATLGSTADGILVINPQGKKIFQNQRTVDLWRIPPQIAADDDDNAQIRHVMNLVTEPDKLREQIVHFYAHPNASGQDEITLKHGTILERMTAPVLGQDGTIYGRIWTFRDITALKLAQESAANEQARLQFIFKSVPVGISLVNQQPDGRITRIVNDAHTRISGLSREEMAHRENILRVIHPDDYERQIALTRQLDRKEISQFSMEKRYVRPDGSLVWVEFSLQRRQCADGSFEDLSTVVDINESKRAEQALRESQALYHSLVDQLPAGIFRKDQTGRFVFVNSWYCRFKGMPEARITGRTPVELAEYELAQPSAAPRADNLPTRLAAQGTVHHALIMRTGQTIELEEEYPGADGRTCHLRVVKSPVYGPDHTIIGTQGMLFDITERKLAEAELAYEQDLLRALLDHSPDHIYFKDAQSRFIKSSHSQAKQFRVAAVSELIGKTDFDFFTEEHARPAFEDEQNIIRTGRPMIGKIEKELWKDGRAESWVLTTKMPFRNKAGEIIGTFGISKDITPLKQTEAALSYERDLLETLMENFPDSIYFKDLQSRFVRVSRSKAAKTFASCLEQNYNAHGDDPLPAHLENLEAFSNYILGKWDFDFLPEPVAAKMYADEQAIIRTGIPIIGRLDQLPRPDGTATWTISTKMLWKDRHGKIIGTFGTTKDITPIKEAEARVEAANKQLIEISRQAGMAEVATNVLHNVGNVLNSINVSAALVADNAKKSRVSCLGKVVTLLNEHAADLGTFMVADPKGRQVPGYLSQLADQLAREQQSAIAELDLLRQNIEHIKDIVAMQQNYAKISGVSETVKASDLVEDALRMNAGALARHEIELVRNYTDTPPVTVEKHKVLQILVNLIRNAKYACDDSGRTDKQLTVSVSKTVDGVRIAVIDNGIGIPPENLTRIFNHGFTTRKGGHGFGLHSGALAAKELGGALTVESRGAGHGATFILDLPAQLDSPAL